MRATLIKLDAHPATVGKVQIVDRAAHNDSDGNALLRVRVSLRVDDLTAEQVETTAAPQLGHAMLGALAPETDRHVNKLAIRRDYVCLGIELAHPDFSGVDLHDAAVVGTPILQDAQGVAGFAFVVEVVQTVEECADLLRLVAAEVALTTHDLQLDLLGG